MGNRDEKGRPARILVADDEPAVADLLCKLLEREGHEVKVASDGNQAIDLARETRPDLIIMDINMPQMNGYEATSRIKETDDLKEVPVLFLSGQAAEEDGGRAFCSGGLTFIRKPFSNWQITDLVNLTLQSLRKA